MTAPVHVGFAKLHEDAVLPQRMTPGSAAMDLRACESCQLLPGRWALVPTGLQFQLPVGYEAQIRPRSGLAYRFGITVLNAPGTIDADYTGPVGVLLVNHGTTEYWVEPGDRIAQVVIARVLPLVVEEWPAKTGPSARTGGYGSTGR